MAEDGRSVFIIVPVFPEDESIWQRHATAEDWYRDSIDRIEHRYDLRRLHFYQLYPGLILSLRGGATITYSVKGVQSKRVPKGLAVRLALTAILDLIDGGSGRSAEQRNQSFIVQIDGSGAFKLDDVEKVLDKLIFENAQVVLGQRGGPSWFMGHPDRKKVELFENFLLEQWHLENCGRSISPILIDGQAGCWGVNAGILRSMGLTASSYELEFDLLATAVMNGCEFAFSDQLSEGDRIGKSGHATAAGNVNHSVAVLKLPFIIHKLGWTRPKFSEALAQYVVTHRNVAERALPDEYVDQVRRSYLDQESSR